MKLLLILIFLTHSFFLFCQQTKNLITKNDTIEVLQKIVRYENSISMPGVGYSGMPSRQWYSSAFLISLTTVDELRQMTKDTSASLKLCAYIGLVYYNYPEITLIRKHLSTDSTEISSLEGCVFDRTTVNYAVNHIEDWNIINPMRELLKVLEIDKNYRNELFSEIISGKKIKRYTQLIQALPPTTQLFVHSPMLDVFHHIVR